MTPTEIFTAWSLGATMVKVFPADQLGPNHLRAVKAPFPEIPLMPTGGVTVETLAAFRDAGADAFGVGSPLFDSVRWPPPIGIGFAYGLLNSARRI